MLCRITRKAVKTTAMIGSSGARTGGAAACGRDELTDMIETCEIEFGKTVGHRSGWLLSGSCGACRILAEKRCALLL
jgi:hypothetical protein